jgi:hypothetical protein
MNCSIITECVNNYIKLRIVDNEKRTYGVAFAGAISLFMFFTPVLTIIFLKINLSFSSIFIIFVAWFISFYFIRLYLWNRFGEEVIILKKNKLEIYYDYKFFIDNRKVYEFNKIKIIFNDGNSAFYADQSQIEFPANKFSVIGLFIDKEIICSLQKIPISEIISISKLINEDGSNNV